MGKIFNKVKSKTTELMVSLPTDVVNEVIHAVSECKKVEEIETTKREQIRAGRDVAIAKIRNAREILEKVVDRTFDERSKVLDAQLKAMESALEMGNMQALNSTLSAMVSVLQVNPIGNIIEVSRQIANQQYVLTLDDEEE